MIKTDVPNLMKLHDGVVVNTDGFSFTSYKAKAAALNSKKKESSHLLSRISTVEDQLLEIKDMLVQLIKDKE